MTKQLKILAFAGSLRKESFNKKFLANVLNAVDSQGITITYVDLKDYPLPIYDEDLESAQGIPENGKKLKQMMINHDAFIISSPEYNSSISGVLKNVIDWTSRPEASDPYYLVAFKGKIAAIMSASPGELGGLRGLVHLRSILGNVGTLVLPDQVSLPKADGAFDDKGKLKDDKMLKKASKLLESLIDHVKKLKSS